MAGQAVFGERAKIRIYAPASLNDRPGLSHSKSRIIPLTLPPEVRGRHYLGAFVIVLREDRSVNIISKAVGRWQVWNGLLDYPVYEPPFREPQPYFSREQAESNYEYFLEVKEKRVAYLTDYLAARKVSLSKTTQGLTALDNWLYRFGFHLVPTRSDHRAKTVYALSVYEPKWNKVYHGLNIVNDIAIFVGDCIISKNSNAKWGIWYGNRSKYDHEMQGFRQPCLFGINHPVPNSHRCLLHWISEYCFQGPFDLSSRQIRNIIKSYEGRRLEYVINSQGWAFPGHLVREVAYLSDPSSPERMTYSQFAIDD